MKQKLLQEVGKAQKPSIDDITSEGLTVTGNAEGNAKIKVLLENNQEYIGFANDSGRYNVTIPRQDAGKKVRVSQTTATKGESEYQERNVRAVPSNKPIVYEINSENTYVTGKSEPLANIKVILEDGRQYTGTSDNVRKLQCKYTKTGYEQKNMGNTNTTRQNRICKRRNKGKRSSCIFTNSK